MEFFRIRFINKIRPDTIEIRYRAVLESHSSDTIFEGHQLFLKNYLDTTILQSGEVALKAIYNIFSATPKISSWTKCLLNNPTTKRYWKFRRNSFSISTSSIMASLIASFTMKTKTESRSSIPN